MRTKREILEHLAIMKEDPEKDIDRGIETIKVEILADIRDILANNRELKEKAWQYDELCK